MKSAYESALIMTVTAGNGIRAKLREEYQRQVGSGGWRAVGTVFGISGGMAYRVAVQGYEPRDGEIRKRLGMSVISEVEFVSEKSQATSRKLQAVGVDICTVCGEGFVSNHPRRRKCFRCSPYRGST